jgi:osmotically-inducible protein OsmY
MSSAQIQQQIQDKLDSEPELAKSNVKANVNDSSVILTGFVDSEREHQLALGIAEPYAGAREILDRIQVKGST